jgi:hypothetical protein
MKQPRAASNAIASMSTVSLAETLLPPSWLRCQSCNLAGSVIVSNALFSRANAAASPPLSG